MDSVTQIRHARSLLVTALAATLGCATTLPSRTHPELPQRKGGIASVGVLPPAIAMFEERAGFGMNKAVPHDEWSSAAADVVAKAFAEEMAADHLHVVPIPVEEPEAGEFAGIYSAVEFSILRHAFEKNTGEILPREPFPEQIRNLDYSLGPAADFMDRHHVDAVWMVRGFNLLPTPGANAKHGVDIALSVLGALGGVAVPVFELQKIQLRVALVDRTGSVLYYGVADDRTEPPDAEEGTDPPLDLRDPRTARHYLEAALSAYRGTAAP
jgi:hypothetical protein